mgnify:CR=1 FL=1
MGLATQFKAAKQSASLVPSAQTVMAQARQGWSLGWWQGGSYKSPCLHLLVLLLSSSAAPRYRP